VRRSSSRSRAENSTRMGSSRPRAAPAKRTFVPCGKSPADPAQCCGDSGCRQAVHDHEPYRFREQQQQKGHQHQGRAPPRSAQSANHAVESATPRQSNHPEPRLNPVNMIAISTDRDRSGTYRTARSSIRHGGTSRRDGREKAQHGYLCRYVKPYIRCPHHTATDAISTFLRRDGRGWPCDESPSTSPQGAALITSPKGTRETPTLKYRRSDEAHDRHVHAVRSDNGGSKAPATAIASWTLGVDR